MKTPRSQTLLATAGAALAARGTPANAASADDLVARIRGADDRIRGEAWQNAGPAGAAAVGPLSKLLTDPTTEVARAAKRALYNIVYYAGRPGAAAEARAVERQLIPLLKDPAAIIRREVLWLLSEIGGDDAVDPMATLLDDPAVRDDARMALQRVPGEKSLAALRAALSRAPEDFRYNLAEALAKRGQPVREYPTRKLIPTKQTTIEPKA